MLENETIDELLEPFSISSFIQRTFLTFGLSTPLSPRTSIFSGSSTSST